MGTHIAFADLPTWAIVAAVVLGAIQLALQVFAVVHVLRTPVARLRTGRPWVWIVVIATGIVGVAVYFAAGREPTAVRDPVRETGPNSTRSTGASRAADVLYGSPEEAPHRSDGSDRP